MMDDLKKRRQDRQQKQKYPQQQQQQQQQQAKPAVVQLPPPLAPLPAPIATAHWMRVVDAASGNAYWYDPVSGVSQWEVPQDVQMSPIVPTRDDDVAAAIVAAQRRFARPVTADAVVGASASTSSATMTLEVDWAAMLDRSGVQNQLTALAAQLAAGERAQDELRAAAKSLDKRVAGNDAKLAEHAARIAELEERHEAQSAQLNILQSLQNQPNQLLFYRTLMINLESVFLSCKAVAGGFVDAGGDAANNKTLTGAAKALKVCGAVLSLAPGGSLIKGAANITAAALEQANAARRQGVIERLAKAMTLSEATQVASDAAYQLAVAFAGQLELLAPFEPSVAGVGGFLAFLKKACGVGGQLAMAYVTGDGSATEMIATAKDAASDAASGLLAGPVGALVGTVTDGPTPFAQVMGDYAFLWCMVALEEMRTHETPKELTERLVRAVLDMRPAPAPLAGESGARRLLNRLRAAASNVNKPGRSLSVFVNVAGGGEARWREVPLFDLLTRCGVQTATGQQYTAPHCDVALFGWCISTDEQAGRRGFRVVAQQPGDQRGKRDRWRARICSRFGNRGNGEAGGALRAGRIAADAVGACFQRVSRHRTTARMQ
jgi:hypothetical protein